ncbi:hypothetical protein [Corynebacterium anserum]|uniref:Septum site-determining protein MinD n=1 Tax=Corynebacterium anserum TaxID=2684406 RepID=A0A7G7YQD4_9CORY|nr:hypothetical protein [Corynebacterium anserum]QNH96704.1 hypothetical protein GP473_08635 [Corynebacterium anserum]
MRKLRGLSLQGEKNSHRGKAVVRPIIIDIEDPALLEEARLVASVTRREIVTVPAAQRHTDATGGEYSPTVAQKLKEKLSERPTGRAGVILLTDRDTELCKLNGVRVCRVDLMEPGLLNGGSVDLAEQIGVDDPLRIAVIGGHGGAGTSIFAAGLAAALGNATSRDALLIDGDPLSQGLNTVLGIENQPGWYSDDVAEHASEQEILQNCPELDGIHVLSRFSAGYMNQRVQQPELSVAELSAAMPRTVLVIDCGRSLPGSEQWERKWGGIEPDEVVIVSAMTVSGLAGAKDARYCVEDAGWGTGFHVIRQIPHAATTATMAMVLLGQRPTCEWNIDADMVCDLDRGALSLQRGSLSKAARAIADAIVDSQTNHVVNLSDILGERNVA